MEIWAFLEFVTLDSCRYVTDFGIEMLCMATGKKRLINSSTCSGCTNIFIYLHDEVKLNFQQSDLLTVPSFMCLTEVNKSGVDAVPINECKILVLNTTENFNFIHFLENKTTTDIKQPFKYSQLKLDVNNLEYKYNVIEIDSVNIFNLRILKNCVIL